MLQTASGITSKQVSPADTLSDVLLHLVRSLVASSDAVRVDLIENGSDLILELRVAPTDMGRIIGKQGQTARSLRIILAQAAAKLAYRVSLDIIETPNGSPNSSF